jgi:hypothetical protein
MQAGTYHWVATYSGDNNNTGARSSCADEPVTLTPGSLGRWRWRRLRSRFTSGLVRLTRRPVMTPTAIRSGRHGCVTETGTDEHDITAVISDATCRRFLLTVPGTIESNGKLNATATGAVQVNVRVKLPRGPAVRSARGTVSHGRWRISLVLPGVNLDAIPPTYVITVHYEGDNTTQQATTTGRIRAESERASLNYIQPVRCEFQQTRPCPSSRSRPAAQS